MPEMNRYVKLKNFRKIFTLKRENFSHRIGLVLVGASLIVLVVTTVLFIMYTRQKSLDVLAHDGMKLTTMVSGYSVTGLEKNDANKLLKIVNFVGDRSGLVFGMIMDSDRKVIAHTDISHVDAVMNDPPSLEAAASNGLLKQVYDDTEKQITIHEFSRPLYANGRKSGAVRLGFSPDIKGLFSDSDIRGLFLVAFLFFSLVPIFYYLVRRSLRSLDSLNTELKHLQDNKEIGKLASLPHDGTDKLVERFNDVISLLSQNYEQLKIAHDDMDVENKVLFYEKDRIESVVDNMTDGVMVTDSVGNIILVNRAMETMMKLSRQEIVGSTLNKCFTNRDIISFIEKNQFYGSVFSQKSLEVPLGESEESNVVRLSYRPLMSREETVTGSIIVARDISVEKAAQQNQSEFIAHVSHELRTPLNTIKSYVEMLMDNEVNSRETKIEFFNTINDETDRLARLINNLLNISKIEMGSLVLSKDLTKTRDLLEDIVASVEQQTISKQVALELSLPEKLTSLVADKDLIRVAILNILSNAIKYTPENGKITFSAEEDEKTIRIDITDTGFGIAEDELPHIFDKFFRSADENIKAQTGNGLGLALSREIIRLHDGEISAESIMGQGTQFTLTLPTEESPRIKDYSKGFHSLMEQ